MDHQKRGSRLEVFWGSRWTHEGLHKCTAILRGSSRFDQPWRWWQAFPSVRCPRTPPETDKRHRRCCGSWWEISRDPQIQRLIRWAHHRTLEFAIIFQARMDCVHLLERLEVWSSHALLKKGRLLDKSAVGWHRFPSWWAFVTALSAAAAMIN